MSLEATFENIVIVDDVPNSQNPLNGEGEINPFPSQSQYLSQPGPSTQPEQSGEAKAITTSTVKKRRGRPSKKDTPVTLPTRGSQRTKKTPKALNYESFQNCSGGEWTERDNRLFLSGCLEVGTEDIKGLKSFLPHKTEREIKNRIALWKELAIKRVEQQLSKEEKSEIQNLDKWVEYFKEKTKSSHARPHVMANIFLIFAEYGKLPTPEECHGVDFRAMYRWIHCMINGIPPFGLNQVTARVLCSSIDKVMERLQNPKLIENLEDHLSDMKPEKYKERFKKTYRRKDKIPTPIERLTSDPTLNPLGLPENALLKKTYESSDED